jgi:hypothetical protein
MGALAWFRRHWKAILGGIFLIPPILRGLRFVLDFGGYIDFVVAHMTEPGWLGVVIADLVDPPSGIILPLILLGLGLIYWDSRRSAVSAPAPHTSGISTDPDAILLIECHLNGLPEKIPETGEIITLALSYGAGSGWSGTPPTKFNKRYGPPGTPCWEWHPGFTIGRVYRCEIINYGNKPIFNLSMSFRVEFHEVVDRSTEPRFVQSGRLSFAYDRTATITKLEPGKANNFIFYVYNQSNYFGFVGLPRSASYIVLGESVSQERPLLPTNMAVLSFPPSEIVS